MPFDASILKSAVDPNIPSIQRSPENGTTSIIRHQTLYEWSKIAKAARIINNDALNNLDVQIHGNTATVQEVPPNSELPITEWFDTIILTPDGTTGNFQLILELVETQNAVQKGRVFQ